MLKYLTVLSRARFADLSPPDPALASKPFFQLFQKALDLELQNQLMQANAYFAESLQQIKSSGEQDLQHYWHIQKRIAHNYRRLGKNKEAQKTLYELIGNKRQSNVIPALIYDDYDILFRHLLTYDLQKSIKLAKALVQQKLDDMPVSHSKLFNFNLGTAYLLAGNYPDAKYRLRNCLQANPQGHLKAYAFNNLALACWWHKNPPFGLKAPSSFGEQIEKDYKQSEGLFQKSVRVAEEEVAGTTLDRDIATSSTDFESPYSVPGLSNLAEFRIANDPIQKVQILLFITKAMETSRKNNLERYFDRLFIEKALLTTNQQLLEETLPDLVLKYRSQQDFVEERFFAKALATVLSNKDQEKARQYRERSELIDSVLPEWSGRLRFLAIDELNLLK